MENIDGVKYNRSKSAIARRVRAKKRLEEQLKLGTKPIIRDITTISVSLTEGDVKRIKKELETIKQRIL